MSGLCSRHASLYDVRSPNVEYLTQTETQTQTLRKLAAAEQEQAEGAGKDVQ